MISDVLFEALTDIEPYLKREPHCLYGEGETAMIQALQAHMKFVLRYLDTPPEQSVNRDGGTKRESENKSENA